MNDVLERLLVTLSVRLHAFAVCHVVPGTRLAFEPMDAVTVHYVLAGRGTLGTSGTEALPFAPRTLMIVPAGVDQTLGDAAATATAADERCRVVGDGLVTFATGDGPADILCICGTITANYAGAVGLFDELAGPIAFDLVADPPTAMAFDLLVAELAMPALGSQALCEALMKQVLVRLLRAHLLAENPAFPLTAALGDPRLARAALAIAERPAERHTIESLARIAGMSRTVFAERFSATYGHAPISFLMQVRLRLAARFLVHTDLPVKVIAGSIGYQSRSQFSRAFRDAYGVDPSAYRSLGASAAAATSARAVDRIGGAGPPLSAT